MSTHRFARCSRSPAAHALACGVVAVALSLLFGCSGSSDSATSSQPDDGTTSQSPAPSTAPTPAAPIPVSASATGASLYVERGCVGCHGADGKASATASLTKAMTVTQLTDKISTTMPPSQPGSCAGACATLLAQYIYDTFTDKTAAAAAVIDPLAHLPSGPAQFTALCARLAARNVNDKVHDTFCGATPPAIGSLTQLQTALGLNFANPTLAGRNNNGRGGNPAFAISGHSSSLVTRSVSAINPRAIVFTPPVGSPIPGFVAMGFVRGDQLVEMIAHDRTSGALDFYLGRITQACNVGRTCTPGDLLTPAAETNWTSFTIYDETDLKNTTLDCTQCHQPGGPATTRILRMQERANPWNHWFRDNRAGGQALLADFQAAHGTAEGYAGIPAALITSSDPAKLENLVKDHGFTNQPNIFSSGNIEPQVNQTTGQPTNNDVPGTSAAWSVIFKQAELGLAIPVPYHDIKVTESSSLAAMTTAYQKFLAGTLAANALPDIRNVQKTSRLYEIAGIAPRPGLDGAGIVTAMCTQCHNSRLDQTITRARFNVDLAAMSNVKGGVLTGADRDTEIGTAITRLLMPAVDVRKMPPESMKTMSGADINLAITYLCAQTKTPIPQCAGR